ncbi:transposase, partial [Blautia wexlerae]
MDKMREESLVPLVGAGRSSKYVKIVEAEICPDHVHMLVEIPPSISVSYFV